MVTNSYNSYTKYRAKHLFTEAWLIAGKATALKQLHVTYIIKRANA